MKRSKQLQPLSRQHHNGLLAVLLLRKGYSKNADPARMARFILNIWTEELDMHFQAEEALLLPALAGKSFPAELSSQLLTEHAAIRKLIQRLEAGECHIEMIREFAEILDNHIRFEERTYFPAAEAALSQDELDYLAGQLVEDKSRNCMSYPDKFWE